MLTHKSTGLRYRTKPWRHQHEALVKLLGQGLGALYTKPGSGKTKVMIDLIYNSMSRLVLIVAPKKVCPVWPQEFEKHFSGRCCVEDVSGLSGEKKYTRVKSLLADEQQGTLVVVINYDSIWRKPGADLWLKVPWDVIICDESHRIKTPGSRVSKYLACMGKLNTRKYIMTGTPTGQAPMDIYAQYRFLNPDIFGTNASKFSDRYENVNTHLSQQLGYKILDKKNPFKNMDELREKMMSCAYVCTSLDLDLPDTHHVWRYYEVNKDAQKILAALRDPDVRMVSEEAGDLVIENVATLFVRAQQILSGYYPVTDDDGNVTRIELTKRERLEEFVDLVKELGEEPVVAYMTLKYDFKLVEEALDAAGITWSEVSGRANGYEEWRRGETQLLLVQPQSGSEGLDMTRAHNTIYYTKSTSRILYDQSLKRTHRPGQKASCTYYHICGRLRKGKSPDEVIAAAHALGKDVEDYLLGGGDF